MKKRRSASSPFTSEMLRDLDVFVFIQAQLMFSSSVLGKLVVHGAVVVRVVMASV